MSKTALGRSSWKPAKSDRKWSPAPFNLGEVLVKGNGETEIGLSILSVGTTMGTWSALAPSWFTLKSFSTETEKDRANARTTIFLAGGASLLMSGAFYMVFRRTMPAIAGALATLGLFGVSWYAIHSGPSSGETSTMRQKRDQQIQQQNASEATPQGVAP